jgi:hypothetical protein
VGAAQLTEADTADDRPATPRASPDTWDGKAITELMSTPHGRRLVERFLDHCGAGARRYQHDGDALGMAWRDGLADAGHFWEALVLHHCPDLYLRMIRERRARLERDRATVKRKEDRRDPATEPPVTVSAVEELADEQARLAREEEERRAREAKAAAKAKKD